MSVNNVLVKKSELIKLKQWKKGRRRPKITLVEVLKNDVLIKEVTESIALDEIEWWKIIHVVALV